MTMFVIYGILLQCRATIKPIKWPLLWQSVVQCETPPGPARKYMYEANKLQPKVAYAPLAQIRRLESNQII